MHRLHSGYSFKRSCIATVLVVIVRAKGNVGYIPGWSLRIQANGLTENDGHENDGPSKLQDMKLQDMKKTDQIAGHENAGHEIAGPNDRA